MRKLLTAILISLALCGSAFAQSGVGQLPAFNVSGNPTASAAPPTAFPIFSTANAWTATQTNTPPGLTNAFVGNHALSGSIGGSVESCISVCVNITSDTVASGLGVNAIQVTQSFGGSSVTGTRSSLLTQLTQTAPTNAANPFPAYVGATPIVITSGTGDGGTNTGAGAKGTYFGANPQARSSATNVLQLTGTESDVFGTSAATQHFQFGHSAVGLFVNNAATLDAAYEIHMGASAPFGAAAAPGPGWKFGLVAAELSNGYVPIAPTGTFIGTFLGSIGTIPVLNVIDIRGFTPSGSAIIGNGFSIDPSGNIGANSFVTSNTVTASTVTNGASKLIIGTSSGVLQIGSTGAYTANGSVATVLGSLGPVGSHTTVQKWLTITESDGSTVGWIPVF